MIVSVSSNGSLALRPLRDVTICAMVYAVSVSSNGSLALRRFGPRTAAGASARFSILERIVGIETPLVARGGCTNSCVSVSSNGSLALRRSGLDSVPGMAHQVSVSSNGSLALRLHPSHAARTWSASFSILERIVGIETCSAGKRCRLWWRCFSILERIVGIETAFT